MRRSRRSWQKNTSGKVTNPSSMLHTDLLNMPFREKIFVPLINVSVFSLTNMPDGQRGCQGQPAKYCSSRQYIETSRVSICIQDFNYIDLHRCNNDPAVHSTSNRSLGSRLPSAGPTEKKGKNAPMNSAAHLSAKGVSTYQTNMFTPIFGLVKHGRAAMAISFSLQVKSKKWTQTA